MASQSPGTPHGRILLARTPALVRALDPLLAANRAEADHHIDWASFKTAEPSGGDLVLLMEDKLLNALPEPDLISRLGRDRRVDQIALGTWRSAEALVPWLKSGIRHFVNKNSPELSADVLRILSKLHQVHLGLAPYLSFGTQQVSWTVLDSADKEARLDELDRWVQRATGSQRLGLMAREAADELIINALFHGPMETSGARPNQPKARHEHVTVPPGSVTLAVGYDGDVVGLSVSDTFGSLDESTLVERLGASGEGSGIGLYATFQRLGHMIVNLVPGRMTEIIGFVGTGGGRAPECRTLDIFVYGGEAGQKDRQGGSRNAVRTA